MKDEGSLFVQDQKIVPILREAEKQGIIITRHGKPAGVVMTPEVRHFITEALRVLLVP